MRNFTHITIKPNAFDLDENFNKQMNEALRQEKIARAAPELLEVLKLCRQHMYDHASNTPDEAFNKMCAAIAKAEGKQ